MSVRILASVILLAVFTSFNVNAASHNAADNGIKYNFVEFRFVDVKGGDGIEFGGSYRINEQFYAIASVQDLDDNAGGNTEILEFGGGYIIPRENIDFAAEFAILDADFPASSESGFALAAGGRTNYSAEIELRAFVRHVDIVDSDTFIELGADYYLQNNLSLGITIDVASDSDAFSFGARYYF